VKIEITEREFQAYEAVRASGVTNMWDVGFVCRLSGLKREKVFQIMKRYSELNDKYSGVRND
jgi:hypothetical protein